MEYGDLLRDMLGDLAPLRDHQIDPVCPNGDLLAAALIAVDGKLLRIPQFHTVVQLQLVPGPALPLLGGTGTQEQQKQEKSYLPPHGALRIVPESKRRAYSISWGVLMAVVSA